MNIQAKIEQVHAELQQVAEAHNKLLEQKNAASQRFSELQGALKVLNELKDVDTDTDSEDT